MLTIERLNKEFDWGNFDLVVIDESHNFRNATPSKMGENGEIVRLSGYDKLLRDVLKEGSRQPKVLLLSATPVNNSLNDLKHQIRLIAMDDDKAFSDTIGITSVEGLIKTANKTFIEWAKNDNRTKNELLDKLNPNFFNLLDELTISRSRKQIRNYYDIAEMEIDKFPKRAKPKSIYSVIDKRGEFPSYKILNDEILKYNLYLFKPSVYLERNQEKYQKNGKFKQFTQKDREKFLIGMMKVSFLKRLESSIYSFTKSMENTIYKINQIVDKLDRFEDVEAEDLRSQDGGYYDEDDELSDFFSVGKKLIYKIEDLDYKSWKKDLKEDLKQIEAIYEVAREVTPDRDSKLEDLKKLISEKAKKQNKKIIVFTAFSDTAQYLHQNLASYIQKNLNLHTALVTGNGCKTSFGEDKYDEILTNFSPFSKTQKVRTPHEQIDILFATDCISEGQNLQDCDCVVNYDIHWNPVRLIQRFGRIDRIGSINDEIQMVNFWVAEDLDEYIKLRSRVESKMVLVDAATTVDDNILEPEDVETCVKAELSYREKQIKRIEEGDHIDLEDAEDEMSLTDFSFEDFRADLLKHMKTTQKELANLPIGIHAVTTNEYNSNGEGKMVPRGIVFCLKQRRNSNDNQKLNKLQPYYLVYITDEGEVKYTFEHSKKILEIYRELCLGKDIPNEELCIVFDKEINEDGMAKCDLLLQKSIEEITKSYQDTLFKNVFHRKGGILPKESEQIKGDDDFELITWLIIK